MNNLYTGQEHAPKHISKANIKNIKIPVHSLEKQNDIVEYCENNENNIKKLEKDIEYNKAQMAKYMNNCRKIIEF